ncbi:MAG: hypothetical protein ACREMV_11560, partial [Gemmatimonadales bacterium]
ALVSDVLALLTLAACGLATRAAATPPAPPALMLLAAGAVAALQGQVRLHRVRHEGEAHRAILPVLHAYVLLCSALAALHAPEWGAALGLGYGGFVWALSRRPLQGQI